MKIRAVDYPKGIRHFRSEKVSDLDGRRYVLTMSSEELRLIPENIVKRLTLGYWSEDGEINRSEAPISCFLKSKSRWRLLTRLAGDRDLSVSAFRLYVGLTEKIDKRWKGQDAFTLVSFVFSGCIDVDAWRFDMDSNYSVERTSNGIIVVTVPPGQYAAFKGSSTAKFGEIIDLFYAWVGLDITVGHTSP